MAVKCPDCGGEMESLGIVSHPVDIPGHQRKQCYLEVNATTVLPPIYNQGVKKCSCGVIVIVIKPPQKRRKKSD